MTLHSIVFPLVISAVGDNPHSRHLHATDQNKNTFNVRSQTAAAETGNPSLLAACQLHQQLHIHSIVQSTQSKQQLERTSSETEKRRKHTKKWNIECNQCLSQMGNQPSPPPPPNTANSFVYHILWNMRSFTCTWCSYKIELHQLYFQVCAWNTHSHCR